GSILAADIHVQSPDGPELDKGNRGEESRVGRLPDEERLRLAAGRGLDECAGAQDGSGRSKESAGSAARREGVANRLRRGTSAVRGGAGVLRSLVVVVAASHGDMIARTSGLHQAPRARVRRRSLSRRGGGAGEGAVERC